MSIVAFSGLGDIESVQTQISIGIGALAGSTVMLSTIPWALRYISWICRNHVHIVLSVVVWISMKMEKEPMRSLRELPLYFLSLPTFAYQIDLVKIIQSSSLVYDKNWC